MFGCCVAGRLLQTNMQQVSETQAMFELSNANSINHICVFLLGTVPFPEGYGATVHFHWPGKGFQLLGMLSNEKPSAIFRLRGSFSSTSNHGAIFGSGEEAMSDSIDSNTANLGIAIEPLSAIETQISNLPSTVAKQDPLKDPTLLAERIVKNLFNYVSGFVGVVTPESAVPMGLIAKWYEYFLNKTKNTGVGFLEREQ